MSISSTLVDRAEIRFHEAPAALRAFVGCFWVVTAEAGAMIRVVPDGSAAISIQLDDTEVTRWVLRGPLLRPDERRFSRPAVMVGVRLRPGVAFLLSRVAAHAMVGRRLDVSRIAGFDGLAPRYAPAECLDALRAFLLRRLDGALVNGLVAGAVDEIGRGHGCVRVDAIAARCGSARVT